MQLVGITSSGRWVMKEKKVGSFKKYDATKVV